MPRYRCPVVVGGRLDGPGSRTCVVCTAQSTGTWMRIYLTFKRLSRQNWVLQLQLVLVPAPARCAPQLPQLPQPEHDAGCHSWHSLSMLLA